MKTDDIKKLIEAFYNGETSAEDERKLLLYFTGENVAEELLEEKELFLNLYEGDSLEVPPALESKLSNLIDNLAQQDETKEVKLTPQKNKRKLWLWAGSAAAGIALLVSVGVSVFDKPAISVETPIITASVEDRQKIEEAQKALLLVSTNFNKGVDQLSVVSENLDKTNEILNRTFRQ